MNSTGTDWERSSLSEDYEIARSGGRKISVQDAALEGVFVDQLRRKIAAIEEIGRLAGINTDMLAALRAVTDALEVWVQAAHMPISEAPPEMIRYERDMEQVRAARAVIAKAEGKAL